MSAAKKKKRKSQAPVALVYFVTVLLFLGMFAMLSIYLLKEFNVIDDKSNNTDAVTTSITFNNLYARVNSKGVLADLAVVRISPATQRIVVVPMSAFTICKSDSSKNFREIYEAGGITKLKSEIKETFGFEIDNYMSITNSAFETVADIFGGMTYTPEEELYYLSQENNDNDISLSAGQLENLSGRQIRLLCQYPVFSNGREGNLQFLGQALTSLLNSAFQQSNITTDNLQNIYEITTANSDTDMTTDDFKLQKSYIKEMLLENLTPAEEMCPEGTWTDNNKFEVSDDFVANIKTMIQETAPAVEASSDD